MHSPRATYERVECFGRILNESRADTMTVVMRYHARGTARSLGHQRPVLRGFAEGTPWDKMQVMSEKTYSMLLTEMVTSFIICFVLVISMFDLGSFVMRIFTYSYLFWMSSFKKCLRYSIRCASFRCTYYVLEFFICPVTCVVVYSAMITVTVTYGALYLFVALLTWPLLSASSALWATRCYIVRYYRVLFGSHDLESALMMEGDDESGDWDARKYPKARPSFGRKGIAFETFVRNFGASMAMEMDDDSDLEETMLGTDVGGDVYLAGGGAAPGAAGTRRRIKRLKLLYGHIYRHVPDLRLQEMMHAACRNDGRAAFRMLVTHCRRDITDLELAELDEQ